MKKKMVVWVMALFLLLLQTQTVFSQSYNADFLKEVGKNDFRGMERILQRRANQMDLAWCTNQVLEGVSGLSQNNIISVLELLRKYGATFNEMRILTAFENRRSDDIIIYLIDNTIFRPDTLILSQPFRFNRSDLIIQHIIDKGIKPHEWSTLRYAIQARRFTWIPTLISLGADVNANRNGERVLETPLMLAADEGNLEIVKLLINNGAKVNLRDEKGRTAASIAYDKGEIEIYNYLKANGAVDFEPRQVAQQPTPQASTPSTTNVYVQPSAPAPAPARTQTPSTPTLQTGRYAYSGTNVTMELLPVTRFVTLYSGYTTVGNGSYNINGNTITITILQASGVASSMVGKTYAYTIMSDASFSGNGETWYKR